MLKLNNDYLNDKVTCTDNDIFDTENVPYVYYKDVILSLAQIRIFILRGAKRQTHTHNNVRYFCTHFQNQQFSSSETASFRLNELSAVS